MPHVSRPNFVVCVFDSLSGSVGSDWHINNPDFQALSDLSKRSVTFSRCYTPSPESSPARASLFTGLDPAVHGLWTNGVTLPASAQTFTDLLCQAGYRTYLAGRLQLAGVSRWTTEHVSPAKFTELHWAHGPLHRSRQNAYLVWLQQVAPDAYAEVFPTQADPDKTLLDKKQRVALLSLPNEFSFNYWVGTQLCTLIASTPVAQPFVAVAGFCVGDRHGTEPDNEFDGEDLETQALQQADTALALLLDQLNASHVAEDTIVIVVSARGNAAHQNLAMKERSIRVPLLIQQSGLDPCVIDRPISTMDVAPTVLALAGVESTPRIQGHSLVDIIQHKKVKHKEDQHKDIHRGWTLCRLRHSDPTGTRRWQTTYCIDSMKLVINHVAGVSDVCELYNLNEDPDELHNLANLTGYAAELERMIDQMIDARCALEDRTEPRIAEF